MNPKNTPLWARQLNTPLVCLLTLLAVLAVAGCGSGDSSDESDAPADSAAVETEDDKPASADSTKTESKPKKKRERTTSVNVAKVVTGDLVVPVIAEGTIRARQSAEIRTEINGRITRILASEGQNVRKGSLILKLDAREYQVAAQEARSKYLQALSVLAVEEDSINVIERSSELMEKIKELERLEESGAISREERLAREVALDVEELKNGAFRVDMVAARSGVTAARMDLERAYLNLERTEIRAPFSGVVSGLTLSEGEHVVANQTVCTIVNNTNLEAQVGVLESDIGNVGQGRPALLAIPALGDTLRVTVDVVSPHFDRNSRTCDVLLRLEDTTGRVKPGMFTRAIIAGERLEDRLLVPRESILTRDGRPLLFKVEGDRAKWLYLKLGRQNDYVVEVERVLQGGSLSPGDRVVVSNHLTLSHDAKIKVKKTVPIGDPWGGKE
ncbi:MAG: efflux RND transporter periplasmic adaptor subunit [Candidatus Latescibacterota bacterium]|nr:MAG: efflux RND transporter periplasmic adaptor subunit [Candidatus Latescibacterota bacterium]